MHAKCMHENFEYTPFLINHTPLVSVLVLYTLAYPTDHEEVHLQPYLHLKRNAMVIKVYNGHAESFCQ